MRAVVEQAGGLKSIVALEDGALITGTIQDCTPIAERAKAMHNEGLHGSADWKYAGAVPSVMIEKYCNDNGITLHEFSASQDHKKRLLNDPAIAHFRIWKGRI